MTGPVSIESVVLHIARCSRCPDVMQGRDQRLVEDWRDDHEADHVRRDRKARRIADAVLDVDTPGLPWFGFIGKAVEYAEAHGWRYVAWNRSVYRTQDAANLHPRVCTMADIEHARDLQAKATPTGNPS